MTTWPDGVEMLFELLQGMTVASPTGDPLVVPGPDGVGIAVLPVETHTAAQGDFVQRCREDAAVFVVLTQAGWADDADNVEGQELVALEVWAPPYGNACRVVSKAIEDFLVDDYHETPAGFIDDVAITSRFREIPQPVDDYRLSTATYRLEYRPE